MRGGGFSLVVIILVVFAGIYYWSGGVSSQVTTPIAVLDAIATDTEIDFSDSADADFRWNFEGVDSAVEEETVSGLQIQATELLSEQVDSIHEFLIAKGFEEDIMNAADGITGSLRGYANDDLVCTVLSEVVGDIDGLEADPMTYNVTVSCGVYEQEEVEEIVEVEATDEEQIIALFAEKYDKDVSEVEVVMENQVTVFAKGGVTFAGEPGGGIWLAFNGDNGWELVFDGNGSVPCADIEGYDFPVDMVPECVDAEGTLVTLA